MENSRLGMNPTDSSTPKPGTKKMMNPNPTTPLKNTKPLVEKPVVKNTTKMMNPTDSSTPKPGTKKMMNPNPTTPLKNTKPLVEKPVVKNTTPTKVGLRRSKSQPDLLSTTNNSEAQNLSKRKVKQYELELVSCKFQIGMSYRKLNKLNSQLGVAKQVEASANKVVRSSARLAAKRLTRTEEEAQPKQLSTRKQPKQPAGQQPQLTTRALAAKSKQPAGQQPQLTTRALAAKSKQPADQQQQLTPRALAAKNVFDLKHKIYVCEQYLDAKMAEFYRLRPLWRRAKQGVAEEDAETVFTLLPKFVLP